ncbi:MAG: hypothetical protein ACFE9Q_05865 [Candidatus Hodarchaeota archaeon]
MRARACIKCREYVVIHPSNPVNQLDIKKFEKKHLGHTIVTVDLSEIKGIYSTFKDHGAENPSQEAS